ncbi:hypothetical protein CDL15_Pgr018828 [Punica granatum]|uniref:ATP-dependent helicase BRM n=1 Tax=Punica granatum TaxID=22663 RepID=A0A218VV34_PUNGR|nr:hypothetical protein CDL15_Pgr018828 [Punica granatum]
MQTAGRGNGPGRNPPGRAGSTSAAASPSSSSSAVSASHLGFDSTQQLLQQPFLRKPEGNEAFLAYQAGSLQGVVGGSNSFPSPGSSQLPQQSRKLDDLALQHVPTEDGSTRRQSVEQQVSNPMHQAPFQFAFQAPQKSPLMPQPSQQAKMDLSGLAPGKDQDVCMANVRMQEHTAGSTASESHASSSKNPSEQFAQMRPMMQSSPMGQFSPASAARPPQMMQAQQFAQSMQNNQLAVAAQMQAIQAWARENNIDLSQPANANMMVKLIPLMQARMAAQQKANENNLNAQSSPVPLSKPPAASPSVAGTSSPHVNSPNETPTQSASGKAAQTVHVGLNSGPGIVKNNNMVMQQFPAHMRDNQVSSSGKSVIIGNGMLPMRPPQQAANSNQSVDQSQQAKSSSGPEGFQAQYLRQMNHPQPQPVVPSQDGVLPMRPPQQAANLSQVADQLSQTKSQLNGPETFQAQYPRQVSRPSPQPAAPSHGGGSNNSLPSQEGAAQQRFGFTKQQLHVLKAQILAFRRLKKGEGTLPQELLRAIAPPPLELQLQQQQQQVISPGGNVQDKPAGKLVDDGGKHLESNDKDCPPLPSLDTTKRLRDEADAEERATASAVHMQGASIVMKEHSPAASVGKEEQQPAEMAVKSEQNAVQKAPIKNDFTADKGKAVASQVATPDAGQGSNPQASTGPHPKDMGATRKYHGPLFDFPFFTRKHDSFGSGMMSGNNDLTLAYDVKDVLFEEGQEVLNKKRSENMKKIGSLLAVNLERKRIRPDLVLRLQIEEKKLRLLDLQARLRDEVDNEQQEIMAMPDRPYRKFVRLCERQRFEMARQVQVSQKAAREKQLKSIFQWRKKLLEAHWTIRDARIARNRGVAKYHERMLREFSKRKDDDRNKRMEALKNNDVERYREMLLEQQTSIPGDAAERYAVLSTFLTQTEEYLQKLGNKISAAKTQQEVEEAANAAAAAARLQGLSEEEVRAAATCAGEEVMIRHQFVEMNAPKDGSYVNKYYNLAHAVNERVLRQPSMLRAGTLRDYQLVGLQWMLSLYNNKLNGILADEMGLGKTVQVMALIAYLMEFKGNYGPHLIIVPNAVLEVAAMKFNVLVTTYEFIMYDRSKLSKVDWKYIIIDEAQRMKDRESVLARDLDRYRCQRRLLLTGTPLQNDLKELWSLLNLLLPEVFDNKKVFHDWFSKPFQKEGPTPNAEDDWLETEKKVIIIHRLHQILEPFMLRRRVEDVEGSLPPKISIVLKCRMSAIQSAIYDWIKSTGTLRVDPEDEKRRVQKNPIYQARIYRTLNNRCMELRKACNHPLLNYPYYSDFSKDFLVRSCGKLWILDRILIKLQRTGHRVLLFSTMTKLLDIVEEYLQWRRLVYRRIDGTTSLEDRESAIVDFNSPGSDCFIFLLSIRAAGRGLNLQSADTVIIYDPDPNPKNEEQAVARAHRIGQTREVKVIYMEAVVNKISSHQKEDELRIGGRVDLEDDMAGKDRYVGSIESLIRNNIQQYKIDMADEVINAGRFDQRTTHEERRLTLETLLHDEERYQETVHDVPSLREVNRMIARSEEELELFDQMDEDLDWTEEMTDHEQVPKWLRASTREVNAAIAALSKKPSKNPLFVSSAGMESNDMDSETLQTGRKRGRPKGKSNINYKELDDDIEEYSEASSDEGNKYSAREEEGEVEGFDDDDDYKSAAGQLPNNKDQSEEDVPTGEVGNEYLWGPERAKNNQMLEEGTSSGSSAESQKFRIPSPVSSQKFGSLSALDARPTSLSKRVSDELEEGEIAVSGDSRLDRQQSGSWTHDREEGVEDEQVLQPKIKRKRSIRMRPRQTIERPEKSIPPAQRGDPSSLAFQIDHKYQPKLRNNSEGNKFIEPEAVRHGQSAPSSKSKRLMSSRRMSDTSKLHALPESGGRSSYPPADAIDQGSNWDARGDGGQVSDAIQRKLKNVVNKLHRRIVKEGSDVVPLLTDLWRKIESSGSASNLLDLRKIDQRVDHMKYQGVMDLVDDVQLMLKGAMQYYSFSHEVRSEASKVHDLFFDILRIAFPHTDFRLVRSNISFSAPAASSGSGPRHAAVVQGRRHRAIDEVQVDPNPPIKSNRRGAPASASEEGTRIRVQLPRKESGLAGGQTSGREQSTQDSSPLLTHPGDLVICKKKRKEREKTSVLKSGVGPSLPGSPASTPRGMRSPTLSSGPRDSKLAHHQPARVQGWANQSTQPASSSGVGASVGWANPVKRLRSDNGRRRPSHL